MHWLKHVIYHSFRGSFCDLPTFGPHPGLPIVLVLIAGFTLAGEWAGFYIASAFFLPIFMYGGYSRSVDDPPNEEDN